MLEGTFSDEHGDWPAGSYLLNPEGSHHSPFSEQGCLLFVKQRQYPGASREHVSVKTHERSWQPSVRKNTSWKKLYAQEPYTDFMRLESWDTPAEIGQINFPHGAEILVLKGSFADQYDSFPTYCWLRIPTGGAINPTSNDYCELYIKEGALAICAARSASGFDSFIEKLSQYPGAGGKIHTIWIHTVLADQSIQGCLYNIR
ncbi:cupin domain-containing protein [Kineobactrum salinum]|uniref:cupin domain-containing protein n=1 Tax=Kineobactrum salinum TaxID=2708301 RepID=UPI002F96103C